MQKMALCSKTNCFQNLSESDKMFSIIFFFRYNQIEFFAKKQYFRAI